MLSAGKRAPFRLSSHLYVCDKGRTPEPSKERLIFSLCQPHHMGCGGLPLLKQAKLFAFAAVAALLTACGGGNATAPPMPTQAIASSDENNDFALGLARGWFRPSCGAAGDDEAR